MAAGCMILRTSGCCWSLKKKRSHPFGAASYMIGLFVLTARFAELTQFPASWLLALALLLSLLAGGSWIRWTEDDRKERLRYDKGLQSINDDPLFRPVYIGPSNAAARPGARLESVCAVGIAHLQLETRGGLVCP